MAAATFDDFVDQYHRALNEFFKGNPEPTQALYSRRDDATLANPFGPGAKGWSQIVEAMDRAAANYREGAATGFETVARCVTPDLAYLFEVEAFRAKVGSRDEFATGALRVTTVLRREDGSWKVIHRHADPITTARPAESVIDQTS